MLTLEKNVQKHVVYAVKTTLSTLSNLKMKKSEFAHGLQGNRSCKRSTVELIIQGLWSEMLVLNHAVYVKQKFLLRQAPHPCPIGQLRIQRVCLPMLQLVKKIGQGALKCVRIALSSVGMMMIRRHVIGLVTMILGVKAFVRIAISCPQACRNCCSNDTHYKFSTTDKGDKKCAWLKYDKRREDFCNLVLL
jgi:hypothetical protein